MIIKIGDTNYLYSDDKIIQYSSNISIDCPSLGIYKRNYNKIIDDVINEKIK